MAKYKLKTKSSAKRRFSMTSTGKIKRKKANLRHILTKHNRNSKRALRKGGLVDKADAPNIRRMLPYG
ncbi:MAG: 50S ribosomal protein L35 [Candidatus Lambdaproteobacteria bacterium RIFOXYD1_FULL_56_27]|uniref:Large ribosomal subunit protein bL35 n=1 Tax=Candidatus Lambdaproteobacteria bacterium RIFOXYD2_FULL_56_26 TaxID=1817773 RepID=A0A1F6GL67_9PROT|nr:MAG: 50S ribosomal protein L35 [Candidatus Lambdaproteobacteria bacterium RIFOXYD2_FULL_56_26]OGH04221.1 MAG: 50S ribosomal protein L35 [Candidatus Lambdaproteobacteria bacterium RIFOXYC1_FULL_56_13]OGH08863.1 MAG: 50S ribosomal protein L35 [Candidatus Lambdaproteobacteria bacterium RIFOXYD1_FULL_56_27]